MRSARYIYQRMIEKIDMKSTDRIMIYFLPFNVLFLRNKEREKRLMYLLLFL